MRHLPYLIGIALGLLGSTSGYCVTRVLFLGDSLSASSEGLGYNLVPRLPQAQYSLKVAAYCGFSPVSFTHADGTKKSACGTFLKQEDDSGSESKVALPPLADLMSFHSGLKAEIVVIQLGTNLYDYLLNGSNQTSSITGQAQALVNAVLDPKAGNPQAEVIWMAPPEILRYAIGSQSFSVAGSRKDVMYSSLAAGIGHGTQTRAIDSRPYTNTKDLGSDGTHFKTLQKRWLDETVAEIESLGLF